MTEVSVEYREQEPQSPIKARIECAWTIDPPCHPERHRVFPDGCMDIIYTREGHRSSLDVIGTMTRFADFEIQPGLVQVGIRFRPGMLYGVLSTPLTDETAELAAIDALAARAMKQRLDDAASTEAILAAAATIIHASPPPTPVQRALRHIELAKGQVDLRWLASQSNLSERQFRRACIAHTGLSPKQLCRTLRFRHALSELRYRQMSLTDVALHCGYFDQAHFIHDFRQWTGTTPSLH